MSVPQEAMRQFLQAAVQLGADRGYVNEFEIGKLVFPDDEMLQSSTQNTAKACKVRGFAHPTLDNMFYLTADGIRAAE